MLFCLITCPCVATLAVTRSESESWKWMLFQMAGLSGMAYAITLIVYQVGTFLKIGVG
jgi:ferrous iron transport protein B